MQRTSEVELMKRDRDSVRPLGASGGPHCNFRNSFEENKNARG
jgi:hypothetical protein